MNLSIHQIPSIASQRVFAPPAHSSISPIKSAISILSSFPSWLFSRSILTYSNERIAKERLERQYLPLHQKAWQAAIRSASEFPKTIITLTIIQLALNLLDGHPGIALSKTNKTTDIKDIPLFQFVIFHPILEECIFRGVLVGGFSLLQKYIYNHTPRSLQSKTVRWLTSDYARILFLQLLFASFHLQANYQSTYGSVAQALGIFLAGSSCSIEFETTNSLLASSIFHITNNAIVRGIHALTANSN